MMMQKDRHIWVRFLIHLGGYGLFVGLLLLISIAFCRAFGLPIPGRQFVPLWVVLGVTLCGAAWRGSQP